MLVGERVKFVLTLPVFAVSVLFVLLNSFNKLVEFESNVICVAVELLQTVAMASNFFLRPKEVVVEPLAFVEGCVDFAYEGICSLLVVACVVGDSYDRT